MNRTDSRLFRCFDRRYLFQILAAGAAGLLLAFLAARFARGSQARIALVGADSLLFGYIIVVSVLSIRRLDELSQRIHLIAVAFSFTATAVLATAFSLLGHAGLPLGSWHDWVWPFMAFVWAAAAMVINRRYA